MRVNARKTHDTVRPVAYNLNFVCGFGGKQTNVWS